MENVPPQGVIGHKSSLSLAADQQALLLQLLQRLAHGDAADGKGLGQLVFGGNPLPLGVYSCADVVQ